MKLHWAWFQLSWQPGLTTVTLSSQDYLRWQSIHFNESRTQLPDLLLELGHGITSLPFSEACTGFRSGYASSINCACLCTRYTLVVVLHTWPTWWQPPPIYPVARDSVPPTVFDTKPQNWNSSLVSEVSRTPDQRLGTLFHLISKNSRTLILSKNNWKLTCVIL